MRGGWALVTLVVVAMAANAARPCDAHGLLGLDLPGPGPVFVPFPAPMPTLGGNVATGLYYDDRPAGTVGYGPIHTGIPSVAGSVNGDGTWIYLETNGVQGLQRGGPCDLPSTPTGSICDGDSELPECTVANPDEHVF